MKKVLILGIGSVTLLFAVSGCKHSFFHSHLSEGAIVYKILVLDSNNSMASMAPDKMTVKFKNNVSFAQVIAGMGLFEIDFVNDEPNKRIIQMIRLLNKKLVYVADTTAVNKELSQSSEATVTYSSDVKTIAGYKCKKAIIHYKDGKLPDCDVYYTNDIELENPNWATPFKGINGVLMEYRINRYGFYIQFTADKVEAESIDNSTFQPPSDYKKVDKVEIDKMMKSIQN